MNPEALQLREDRGSLSGPQMLFVGRTGSTYSIPLFACNGDNHNYYISGYSGAGTSFLANYIAYQGYCANAMVRMIEVGGSHRKLKGYFGAEYYDLTPYSKVSMNPFTYIREPLTDLPVIANLVHAICFRTPKIIPLDTTDMYMAVINDAVQWAWDAEGADADMDTVYQYLTKYPQNAFPMSLRFSEQDQALLRITSQMLAYNLRDFTAGQLFGTWFNGRSNFDISQAECVVIELEKLYLQRPLFKIVALQAINAVTQDLGLSDSNRQKIIVLDEAWQFMGSRGSRHLANVLEAGYRRARKHQGSIAIITQTIFDLQNAGRAGDLIWANSGLKMHLSSGDFDRPNSASCSYYGEKDLELLRSLKSDQPHYSEIFMDTPFGKGVVRFAVDPYSYYICTTNDAEIAEIEALVKAGTDYAGAISAMVRKYRGNGYGKTRTEEN